MQTSFLKSAVGLLAAAFVVAGSSMTFAQETPPVTITASLDKTENGDNQLVVSLDIKDGWHTFDTVPEGNPSPSTSIALELPEGVDAVGKWKRPASLPYEDGGTVFEGNTKFKHAVTINPNASQREIGVTVSYQVCNDRLCRPPNDFKTTISIPASEVDQAKKADTPERYVYKNQFFAAPERLMVGEQPLNVAAKQMYPSPAVYDVDNDGENELVVGDIFGTLNVYENENSDGGEPIWSKHSPLKTAEGEKIKVSNW